MTAREFELRTDDGCRLACRQWAPRKDSGEPVKHLGAVLIVHGLGEHSGRYAHVASRLTQAGHFVVSYDQRGHGNTGGARGHARDYAVLLGDIAIVMAETRRRATDLPMFLYGHSLGGNLVLNFALRRRPGVDGVIASSPLLRPALRIPRWKTTLGHMLFKLWPAFSFNNGIDPELLSRDPNSIDAYRNDAQVHSRVSAKLAIQMLEAGEWALSHASEWTLPLLLMHGGEDQVTLADASRQFAEQVAENGELRIWDGLRHELHWELEREAVLDVVVDWLARHQPAERATDETRTKNG
ncbi:MAG: lysophospholipase [Planctomycetales bacterium]|nr:lysophospholipase [Planctomycetales bacterium]